MSHIIPPNTVSCQHICVSPSPAPTYFIHVTGPVMAATLIQGTISLMSFRCNSIPDYDISPHIFPHATTAVLSCHVEIFVVNDSLKWGREWNEMSWNLSYNGKFFSEMDPLLLSGSTCRSRLPWWRHQMETLSALLAICAGNSPVPGEFPTQRPVTRSFDVYFDLRPNKRLSKQSLGWWFETLLPPLWRHRNALTVNLYSVIILRSEVMSVIS